jgi:hypothetical protein
MAGDGGSRRFVRFWWVLAFILGASAGAFSVTLIGIPYTAWGLVGFGVPIATAIGFLEWFGERRLLRPHRTHNRLRKPTRMDFALARHKTVKPKPAPRRGQLRAITGRKTADPPSSGAS